MRVVVCDDEYIAIEHLTSLLKDIDEVEVEATFTSQAAMLEFIAENHRTDVLFMDIDWKGEPNGILLSKKLFDISPNTQIIYVTGYNDRFSQHIFLEDSNLCGYLVKPVHEDLLRAMLQRATDRMEKGKNKFVISQRGQTWAIPFDKILYLESKGHNLIIHTKDESFQIYGRLEEYAKGLPKCFAQCHKSYIVNMDRVTYIEAGHVFLGRDIAVSVSKARYKEFRSNYFRYVGESL